MRKKFFECLYEQMKLNENIFFLTGDLGFFIADKIKEDFSDRFVNVGAAEITLVGAGVGLSLEGKIVFCYSITPFLLWRAAEVIRNYVNEEKIKIILCGSGRDHDYHIDGFSHAANDTKPFLDILKNINQYWPDSADDIPNMVEDMIKSNNPSFISLKR